MPVGFRTSSKVFLTTVSLIWLASASFSVAADLVVQVPSGWSPDPFVYATNGENVAVALESTDGLEHRVMQVRGTTVNYTDVAGPIKSLEYAADSKYLLVHHMAQDSYKASLLNEYGDTQWTKVASPAAFEFTSTGEAVASWISGDVHGSSQWLRVYDLNGDLIGRFDATGRILAAASFGNGKDVVVVLGRTIMAFDLAAPSIAKWQIDLADDFPGVEELRILGEDRFALQLALGYHRVYDTSGTLLFEWDPIVLAQGDPSRTEEDYRQYKPFRWSENEIFMYDRTADGMILNVLTSTITPQSIDTSVPPGYSRNEFGFSGKKLVFMAPTTIRIRTLQ